MQNLPFITYHSSGNNQQYDFVMLDWARDMRIVLSDNV